MRKVKILKPEFGKVGQTYSFLDHIANRIVAAKGGEFVDNKEFEQEESEPELKTKPIKPTKKNK